MGRKTNGRLLLDWLKDHKEFDYLLEEWDTERNREELGLEIEDVSYGTKKKVYWLCKECGSSFLQSINKRTNRGDKCNECNKLYNWVKKHQEYQYLLEEFDYEKNKEELGISIKDISYGSKQKVYWKCRFCGKQYQKVIHDYINKNTSKNGGCKSCNYKFGNREVIKSYCKEGRSLRDWCEKNNKKCLLEEFNYEKNMKEFGITPDDITYGSSCMKVYWICKRCGTEYKCSPNHKTDSRNTECCPKCNKSNHTSFSEQTIYFYMKQVFPDSINSYKPDWLKPFEIDVYIPELNLGIEFDGERWHKDWQRDINKNKLLEEHDVTLIRIREDGCPILLRKDCKYIYIDKYSDNYNSVTDYLHRLINFINELYSLSLNIDIDICRDSIKIRDNFMCDLKERSLAITHPQIAKDWHPTKNGGLKPESFSYGSNINVWWKCSKYGGEFQAKICNRIKYGCYCCNKFERKSESYKMWFNECNVVKEHYITNNYLPITERYSEIDGKIINVYGWIRNQRERYRNGKLSDAQIEKLNEIEIILDEIKNKGIKRMLENKKQLDKARELEFLWNKGNKIFRSNETEKAETQDQKWVKIKYINLKGVKKDVRKEEKAG